MTHRFQSEDLLCFWLSLLFYLKREKRIAFLDIPIFGYINWTPRHRGGTLFTRVNFSAHIFSHRQNPLEFTRRVVENMTGSRGRKTRDAPRKVVDLPPLQNTMVSSGVSIIVPSGVSSSYAIYVNLSRKLPVSLSMYMLSA